MTAPSRSGSARSRTRALRRGLVLGGGGVLGAAWMVGALKALEDELGVDAREFDEFVGTSAGSIAATMRAVISAAGSPKDVCTDAMTQSSCSSTSSG